MAQQHHFHFYGGPPGPLPGTGPSPPVTVISTLGDVRPTRSESVHPPLHPAHHCRFKIGHPADRSELPQSMSTKLVEKDRLRNLSGSEAGPGAEGVDTISGDMMKYLTARPMPAPAEPRPAHTFSPPARPPYVSASAGHMPPRPRPSIGPTIQPVSHFRSPDVSPERPPGQWRPSSFTAPSQRPVLPRFRPPPSKSQAEDPLLGAAEMSSNPTLGSDSNKPAARSGASVADLQKTTAPKTPPKHPAPQGSQKPPAAAPVISVDDEQMFQATHRSSHEQLRDQISQRAKGRNAVDFYEEGMTPLLSYLFFVLHYHENLLTTEKMHQWPIIPRSKMRLYTDRIVFTRQFSLPVSKISKMRSRKFCDSC